MTTERIAELRKYTDISKVGIYERTCAITEALDEVERLQAENEKLRCEFTELSKLFGKIVGTP